MFTYFLTMISSAPRSSEALNCGNAFSAPAITFTAIAVNRKVAARRFRLLRVLLADVFERGDVGKVALGDVRNRGPRGRQMLGRLATDGAHRLTLDRAPPREIGQRLGRQAAALAGARDEPLRVRLHVLDGNAAGGPSTRAPR